MYRTDSTKTASRCWAHVTGICAQVLSPVAGLILLVFIGELDFGIALSVVKGTLAFNSEWILTKLRQQQTGNTEQSLHRYLFTLDHIQARINKHKKRRKREKKIDIF